MGRLSIVWTPVEKVVLLFRSRLVCNSMRGGHIDAGLWDELIERHVEYCH